MKPSSRATWRTVQLQTSASFAEWLRAGRRNADIARTQTTITDFLIRHLTDTHKVDAFIGSWASVLGSGCNVQSTYNEYNNVLAYCHLHVLERYRRFYHVLERLYAIGYLPMKDGRVRVLDVGTGPAPCLYALQDFYEQVRSFGAFQRVAELHALSTELRSVEQSSAMSHFMHNFSELAFRPGPFGVTHSDFLNLDLAELRRASEADSKRAEEGDMDDPYAPWPFPPTDYKHDLYIFSNFFTTEAFARAAKDQIEKSFYWLGPGHRVVIMGSCSAGYQPIYDLIDGLAKKARVDAVRGWKDIFESTYDDFSAERVKANYNMVFGHLTQIRPDLELQPAIQRLEDIWNPAAPLTGPKRFRAKLYDRSKPLSGRWRHR